MKPNKWYNKYFNKKAGLWEKPKVRIPTAKKSGTMKDKKRYTRKVKHKKGD